MTRPSQERDVRPAGAASERAVEAMHGWKRGTRMLVGPLWCRLFGHYLFRHNGDVWRCYCGGYEGPPRAISLAMRAQEAIHSVALSHPDSCDCTACRAANGDRDALARVMAVLSDSEGEDGG